MGRVIEFGPHLLGSQLRRSLRDHRCGLCLARWADHSDEDVVDHNETLRRLAAKER